MTKKEKNGIYELVDFLDRMSKYYEEAHSRKEKEEGSDNYWAIAYDWESHILGYVRDNYITKEMWTAYFERRRELNE